MFKKLRVKFIAITMVMVAIVMAFAFSVVCVVEYQRSTSVVQTALDNAVQEAIVSTGRSKDHQGMMRPGARPESSSSSSAAEPSESSASSAAGREPASSSLMKPSQAYAAEPQGEPERQDGQDGVPPNGTGAFGQNPDRNETGAPDNGLGRQGSAPESADEQPDGDDAPGDDPDDAPDAPSGDADDPDDAEASTGVTVTKQSNSSPETSQDEPDASDAGGVGQGSGAFGRLGRSSADEGTGQGSVTISDDEVGQTAPPSIGNRPGQQRPSSSIVPVAVYRIDSNGTLRVVPEITTASIAEDVLQEAADLAVQEPEGFGTFADLGLHYYKAERDGTTFLAFADTSYTDAWKSLALILVGSGIGTLAVFFVVALFYSRWALRPVKEAWDSQRQFVADASHDLKTPLTVILANAAILLKHPDHTIASESQWIESTQKEAEDMQGLVNEMLELAQIEAGQKADTVREPIDLSDLVDGETLLFDSVALERNCSFNCSIDEGVQVLGDEKQVKKLVSTLVENAFKYVDETGTIDVTLRKAGKVATIDIHNTGSTISAEDLPHIFDRFYRTDKARTSGTGGFGLGLAIAREIARQHDGDITCKSTESEGTTFTITLPVAQ